jgi:hypothetical protein
LPRKRSESLPVLADGLVWVSFWIARQPPEPPAPVVSLPSSVLSAFVSPVSSKKNCLKSEPGRKSPFSGRLNGVPLAALARVFALKGAVPSAAVS